MPSSCAPGSDEFCALVERTLERVPWMGRVFHVDYDRRNGLRADQFDALGEEIAIVRIRLEGGPQDSMNQVLAFPMRHPSAGLLFVQVLGILLYPLMDSPAQRALFGAFGLIVLGAALYVVRRGPWLTGFALVLAVPIVGLSILQALEDPVPRRMAITAALEAAFYFYATGSLIAYMLQDQVASRDELFAAGATFTLLAWAFAYAYTVCQVLIPGSFGALSGSPDTRTWMELLFLSFTTLSGVGLGDIIPLTPMARALVMLEQFAGVMYIALVVSRLIALTVAVRRA